MAEFFQTFTEEIIPITPQTFPGNTKGRHITFPSFSEASITLISKPNKNTTKKENYRSISLMNTDAKLFNTILAKQIQSNIKKITHHD
jgi:hypothetical protein